MSSTYHRHRFPGQIIRYFVGLYFTFPLSYRDVEKMMLYRGIFVTYEAIRYWCRKFGQDYANQIHHRRPKLGDKWHLDEGVVIIKGKQYYLWRAVDQAGNVLDILMQNRPDKAAAKKFLRKLLKIQGFAGDHYRQAQELWSGEERDTQRGRTQVTQGIETSFFTLSVFSDECCLENWQLIL